jgi:beta-lactamase regulating signal transducer with metallopeptidase domain
MIAHASMAGIGLLMLKSSLVLAFGWGASRVLRRASAAARHLVWLTVIVAVLLLPLVGELAPVPVRVLPAETLSQLATPRAFAIVDKQASQAERVAPIPASVVRSPVERAPWAQRIDIGRALFAAWAIVAFVLCFRLILGMLSVGRLTRRGQLLIEPAWTHALADAAVRLDVSTVPRLVMSDQVEMAFAFDPMSPAIVVPTSAREWTSDRRRAVLLHELAHIQRRDLLSHTIAGFTCALNWFNPFIWAAARRLRVESELASDEIVLRAGVRPSVYAQHLLDMVTGFSRPTPGIALAMARPKEFEGRLVAILDSRCRHPTLAGRRGGVVALVALPALAIGTVAPAPRVSDLIRPPALELAPRPRADSRGIVMTPAPQAAPVVKRPVRATASVTLSRNAVASLLRFGTGGIVNPTLLLLRNADSLKLTGAQADSIATLNRRYMIRLNQIWSPVSAFYVSRTDTTGPLSPPPGNDPTRATIQALADIVRDVNALLTPEQQSRVAPNLGVYLDARNLPALARSPDGVFMSLDQLYATRGRGRGGG